ncbi:serine/threonine-protein kinase [Stieleria varia]|uniref:Serine/threonine-protein kinase PknB n=1 Tax=Stieleria varia TaxID=2528005 RepID=A0A5C6A6J5_9BACT|nr:serine/threonine-protein kinase [Stieleria varia]TWT93963.1 Serine/threonine-protein kinase PknB [Stieleria varia]
MGDPKPGLMCEIDRLASALADLDDRDSNDGSFDEDLQALHSQMGRFEALLGDQTPIIDSETYTTVQRIIGQVQQIRKEPNTTEASPRLIETHSIIQLDETLDTDESGELGVTRSLDGSVDQNSEFGSSGETIPNLAGYEMVDQLGHGGMGVVWRAIQLSTGRNVALKVMKEDRFSSPAHRYRFQREIELASMLEHPNIARVYEAGVSDGVRYFAMELVDGMTLDRFVRKQKLPSDDILRLAVEVVRAVQVAHQRGVIHRDLKPSNIMVSSQGTPYVLDFGLAKSLREESQGLHATQDGAIAGTPAFMSPEQARGDHAKVDSRSDVYALGVILYRLLTGGKSPHQTMGSTFDMLRRIIEEDIQRPRIANPKIDTDVEAILVKALAKDPDERYGSAGELADDIDRYLAGEPVEARVASTAYYVQKWVRKHRAALAVAASISATIVGLLAFGLVRERGLRREAEVSRATAIVLQGEAEASAQDAIVAKKNAEAVADFLVKTLQSPDPNGDGRNVTVAERLDDALQNLATAFADDPLTHANMASAIGSAYFGLGLYTEAKQSHKIAYDLRLKTLGEFSQGTALSLNALAIAIEATEQTDEGLRLTENAYERFEMVFGPKASNTLVALGNLAIAYRTRGQLQRAIANQEELVRRWTELTGIDSIETQKAELTLAESLRLSKRTSDAVQIAEEIVELRRATHGTDHQLTRDSESFLAGAYFSNGQPLKSRDLILEFLPSFRERFGEAHSTYLGYRLLLAKCLSSLKKYEEAREVAQETYDIAMAVHDGSRVQLLEYPRVLASIMRGQGEKQEAFDLLERSYERAVEIAGVSHYYTLAINLDLIHLSRALQRFDDAILYAQLYLEGWSAANGDANANTLYARNVLVAQLLLSGQYEEAAIHGEQLVKQEREFRDRYDVNVAAAQSMYANALMNTGGYDEAESLLIECNQWRSQNDPDGYAYAYSRCLLGIVLSKQKRFEEAEPMLLAGVKDLQEAQVDRNLNINRRLRKSLAGLVAHYEDRGMLEEAEKWKAKLAEANGLAIEWGEANISSD